MQRPVGHLCASLFLVCIACPAIGAEEPSRGFARVELPTRVINEAIARAWKEDELVPPPRCDDFEFLRRATLDIIGRIATTEELDRYLKDPAETRRGLLVERLLAQPEYARHWSRRWASWLTQPESTIPPDMIPPIEDRQRELTRWLEGQFRQEKMSYRKVVKELLTATGRPEENGAVSFTLANVIRAGDNVPICGCGDEPRRLRAHEADTHAYNTASLTIKTAQVFLGFKGISCCQCHDHPFDAHLKQRDFWALDGCFLQLTIGPKGELVDNLKANPSGVGFYEKLNGVIQAIGPHVMEADRQHKIIANGQASYRQQLAERALNHRNLAPALIDRMWGQFFASNLVEYGPLDDVADPDEECEDWRPLGWLGRHFSEDGRDDPRNLIRWFCASDDYNRKSARTDDLRPYMTALRPMDVGQLVDSLITATRPAPEALPPGGVAALRQQWIDRLTPLFEESYENAYPVAAALTLMNDIHIREYLESSKSETLRAAGRLNRQSAQAAVDHLFKAAWNRPCRPEELRELLTAGGLPANTTRLPEAEADAFLQDLFWSLVNSGGFALRH
jgi:hypothetical protein